METRPKNGALIIPSGLLEPGRLLSVDTLPPAAHVKEGTLAYTIDKGWMHIKSGIWCTGNEVNEAQIEQQLVDWMANQAVPIDGKSAYELAQAEGFIGTMSAWLLSLRGMDGATPTSMPWASVTGAPTIPAAQVNADWNAVSGVAQITNKPTLASVAMSGAYGDLSGTPSLGGYATTSALTSGLAAKLDAPAGTTAQYVRGNGTLATLPVIAARSFSNPTRAFNTAVQLSATRDVQVAYYIDVRVQSLLLGNARGNAFLDYADDSGMSTNLVTIGPATSSISGVLSLDNISTVTLAGIIPAAKYSRIRTAVVGGTASFTMQPGQEVLL